MIGLLLAGMALAGAQEPDAPHALAFTVHVADPESAAIEVALSVPSEATKDLRIAFPAWAPGAYRIVDHAGWVRDLRATDAGGNRLGVVPADEQSWEIRTAEVGGVEIRYRLVVDSGRMDRNHCFIAGPDTYPYVVGHKELPCKVRFILPEGWDVATGLEREGDSYVARDYDTFIDCPTELGRFERAGFEEGGVRYELALHAAGKVDALRLARICRTLVKEHNRLFGPPPLERYLFLYHFPDRAGGRGLEHLNSTDISLSHEAVAADPLSIASITSHEYFHLWNVKRLRPLGLGPFDYTSPLRTRALWFCEGVTSYFGDRALARCGLWSEERYLAHLSGQIEVLQENPDRLVTSVEEASWSVWDREDWPQVSYYNKGELLGLLLDLSIRVRSGGTKSLDDVMRHLYRTYCAGGGPIGTGFPEDGILRGLNEATGEDWGDFYAKHVRGLEELPYAEVLGPAGLACVMETRESADLGVELLGTWVVDVPVGSPAEAAGLEAGDRLIEIGGIPVSSRNLAETLGGLPSGTPVAVKVDREGETLKFPLLPGRRSMIRCRLQRAEAMTEFQQQVLDGWLGGSDDGD